MLSAVYTGVHLLPLALVALGPALGAWSLLAALPALVLARLLPAPLALVQAGQGDGDALFPTDATLAGLASAQMLFLGLALWLADGGAAAGLPLLLATQVLAIACLATLGPQLARQILHRKTGWPRGFGLFLSGALGLAPTPRESWIRPRRHEALAVYLARSIAVGWRRALKTPRATATRVTLALAMLASTIAIGGAGALALMLALWLAVQLVQRTAAYLDGYGLDELPQPVGPWRDCGMLGPAIEGMVLRLGLPAASATRTTALRAHTAAGSPCYPSGRGAMLLLALHGDAFFDVTDPILRPDLTARDPFSRLEREPPLAQPPRLDGPPPGSPLPRPQTTRHPQPGGDGTEAALLARIGQDTAPRPRTRPV